MSKKRIKEKKKRALYKLTEAGCKALNIEYGEENKIMTQKELQKKIDEQRDETHKDSTDVSCSRCRFFKYGACYYMPHPAEITDPETSFCNKFRP